MQDITQAEGNSLVGNPTKKITFLTGAGISTASGGARLSFLKRCVYQGIQQPGILIEPDLLKNREPEKFYQFVKTLYHPADAQPRNIIHQKMAHN